MREMKDSGIEWIGEIPADWNIKRVKAVLCERNESNNPIQTDEILSLTNDRGVIPYEEKGDVGNKSKEDLTGYKLAYPGDIVLNSMNVFIGSVGLSSYFGCVSPVYYMLYPRNKNDSVSFFNYLFQTKELQTKLHGYGNGIMEIRMRIQMSKLNSVQLPVPPSDVQHKIAAYLDRKCSQIDAIIARQQEVIEKLKAYKLSVITEAVTKGLNPHVPMKDSGVEWIGEIPEHWEARKLKSIVEIISKGTTPSTIGSELLSYGEIRFLKAENIQNNRVVLEPEFYIDYETHNVLKRSQLQANDVLFVIAGATIGKTAILSTDTIPANTNQAVSFIRLKEKEDSKYVWYYLQSSYVKTILNLLSVQSAQPNLSMEDMGNFCLCYPSKEERNLITEYLDKKCGAIESSIEYKQRVIELLTAYKKSLIYEVVTGKKEV